MKQNSIFSHVKRNNNSESVDGNEQCSSNVKEAPNPEETKCNSIAKVRKWDNTYFDFCNNCLFVEVSNNEIFDSLRSNSCFLNFC